MAPVPEQMNAWKMPGGRLSRTDLEKGVTGELEKAFGPGAWVEGRAGSALYLNQALIVERGLDPAEVERRAAAGIEAVPPVWRAYTRTQLLEGRVPPDWWSRRVLLSFHREPLPRLQEALVRTLRRFYGDDPRQSPDYGRIVNDRHLQRLKGLLAGQQVVHGGQADDAARYLAPTLVLRPDPASPLMQEEIFGPILPLLEGDDLEAAMRFVAARPHPLALYLFTRDRAAEQRVVGTLQAGNVCVNDTVMFYMTPDLPFGGVGTSGMGRYHGWFGFETYSHMKSVMRRYTLIDPDLRYPPYSPTKSRLFKLLD